MLTSPKRSAHAPSFKVSLGHFCCWGGGEVVGGGVGVGVGGVGGGVGEGFGVDGGVGFGAGEGLIVVGGGHEPLASVNVE